VQGDVLQKNMIWADVNPLSCYGTNDGTKTGPAMVSGLGLPKLQKMVHDFVSGLIKKGLLADDAVVVVLGQAPWSCCEKLGSLLTKLDVHQVDHPVFTGMWAKGQCKEPRMLLAMQRLNNGEQCAVFVYVCHTDTCCHVSHTSSPAATLLRALSAMFRAAGVILPGPATYFTDELANWRADPTAKNNFSYKLTVADNINQGGEDAEEEVRDRQRQACKEGCPARQRRYHRGAVD
jgi:hypothetical protein